MNRILLLLFSQTCIVYIYCKLIRTASIFFWRLLVYFSNFYHNIFKSQATFIWFHRGKVNIQSELNILERNWWGIYRKGLEQKLWAPKTCHGMRLQALVCPRCVACRSVLHKNAFRAWLRPCARKKPCGWTKILRPLFSLVSVIFQYFLKLFVQSTSFSLFCP